MPDIEAKPGAPVGTIASVPEHHLARIIQAGDLIICRMTAPLVSWCLDLIQRQIPACVRGREIGKDLANLARKIANPYGSFVAQLRQHAIEQRQRLEQKNASEGAIQNSDDMCLALEVCSNGFRDCRSVDDLCAAIDNLFRTMPQSGSRPCIVPKVMRLSGCSSCGRISCRCIGRARLPMRPSRSATYGTSR